MPAALPDLAALIGDRETHLRAHPLDGASWAVLGAAYVEQGRRTADGANWPKAEKALRTSLRTGPKRNPQALEGSRRWRWRGGTSRRRRSGERAR